MVSSGLSNTSEGIKEDMYTFEKILKDDERQEEIVELLRGILEQLKIITGEI